MARIGVANYNHSTEPPFKQDAYWRETMERGQRDHAYSVFNNPFPRGTYAHLNTTSNDYFGRTWEVMHRTRQAAAGKSSFHTVSKPPGAGSQDRPGAVVRGTAAAAAGQRVLHGSISAPALAPAGGNGQGTLRLCSADSRRSRRSDLSRASAAGSQRGYM
uniref:Uncharacterized protein n=1 Tax=Zooxanthella nutricula TaxID=1333877 RepID=A0A6U6NPY7_9DINO|mmetsp:Transcript_51498/g.156524  ORF Transcript_51498/g.156524 Transcript_51498/m.156524 type:complete len:160 (+) Transcript_51498:64-543(+)